MSIVSSMEARNSGFPIGMAIGFSLGTLSVLFLQSSSGVRARERVRSRVNEVDIQSARVRLSASAQSSATKGKAALATSRTRAISLLNRPTHPVELANGSADEATATQDTSAEIDADGSELAQQAEAETTPASREPV